MSKPDLVFAEFGTAHEDCFYSHFLILQQKFDLHIILNEKMAHLLPASIDYASVTPMKVKGRSSLATAWEARRKIKSIRPTHVCFSTAQGNVVRDLTLLMPRGIELFGMHHNADKLLTSSSQKLINWRLKKYLLPAEFVEETLRPQLRGGLKVSTFYPCYYENLSPLPSVQKPNGLLVAIPGVIEQSRRDYDGFLAALKKQRPSDVHFVMLGNGSREDGPRFQQAVKEAGLSDLFTFFNAYVGAEDMQAWLQASDAILPILHPGVEYFPLYEKYKITGSYDLAYGYHKPMFLHSAIGAKPEFADFCLTYELENFVATLDKVARDRTQLKEIAQRIAQSPRFDFEKQKRRYLAFIEA